MKKLAIKSERIKCKIRKHVRSVDEYKNVLLYIDFYIFRRGFCRRLMVAILIIGV